MAAGGFTLVENVIVNDPILEKQEIWYEEGSNKLVGCYGSNVGEKTNIRTSGSDGKNEPTTLQTNTESYVKIEQLFRTASIGWDVM